MKRFKVGKQINTENVTGLHPLVYGDFKLVAGNVSRVTGDVTGFYGDLTGFCDNVPRLIKIWSMSFDDTFELLLNSRVECSVCGKVYKPFRHTDF